MEYYGYKDRGEAGTPIVDWGKIASDLTEKLTTVEAGREAKRKEIDEVTQNYVDEINKVDVGHSQSMGTFIQDAANSTKQYALMQQKLLKQGKIDPNQYKMNLQNQKDSWAAFTGVSKNWNTTYDKFLDLQSKGLVGQQAADMMEKLGAMQDLQKKKAYIDPASGNLYAAEYDKDGKIDTTSFQPTSATSLLKLMGDTPLKVNVTAEVAKNSKIAEFKKMTAGSMVSDPTARPEYSRMADQIANSVLYSDRATGSVLMDSVGGYKATFQTDPKKYTDEEKELYKAGKLITYKLDGSGNYNPADFTPAQIEDARKAVKDNLRSQLGYESEPIKQPSGGGGRREGAFTDKQLYDIQQKQVSFGNIQNLINPKTKAVIGKTISLTNAIEKKASGFQENTEAIGLSDKGKLTMKVSTYKGSESTEDYETGAKSTLKSVKSVILNEDQNSGTIDKKLRQIGFNSIQEAKDYLGGGRATTTKKPPVAGEIIGGYKFRGGDPSNKNNYIKV